MGDFAGANEAWTSGLGALPRGAVERPFDSNVHAALLQRLGRTAEAQPLTARLNSLGYRLPV
jgi:hypothetical protein